MRGNQDELKKLLEGFDTAMLTTRGPDGHFHTRPMALQKAEGTAVLWFATSLDTQKVQDLEGDADCGVSFYKGGHDATYVSLSGSAELVRDRQKIHELWNAGMKPWFPEGPDSPDLCLLRFEIQHAEYVHPESGKLKVLFTMAKSLLTGERAEVAPKKELDALQ